MGRVRKYFTAEEKVAANRAKSKRYYEKAKESINDHRWKVYNHNNRKRSQSTGKPLLDQIPGNASPPNPSQIWLDQAQRLEQRLNRYIDGDAYQFLDSACVKYLAERDRAHIEVLHKTLETYQKLIRRYQDNVLQLEGLGHVWREIDIIKTTISMIISWAQDIYCTALLDIDDEFSQIYSVKGFEFQSSPQV